MNVINVKNNNIKFRNVLKLYILKLFYNFMDNQFEVFKNIEIIVHIFLLFFIFVVEFYFACYFSF